MLGQNKRRNGKGNTYHSFNFAFFFSYPLFLLHITFTLLVSLLADWCRCGSFQWGENQSQNIDRIREERRARACYPEEVYVHSCGVVKYFSPALSRAPGRLAARMSIKERRPIASLRSIPRLKKPRFPAEVHEDALGMRL